MKKYILIIKLVFASILSNKLRAFLTMLGIIIGVSSVIAIMSIGAGAESLITGSIKKLGTNTLMVMPGAADDSGPPASAFGIIIKTLTTNDADAIEKIPNVEYVTSFVQGNGEVVYGAKSEKKDYSGVSKNFMDVENHTLKSGRFFNAEEDKLNAKVTVLGSSVATDFFSISDPIGKKIRINNVSFRVIGVLNSKGAMFVQNPDDQIYIPLNTAKNILLNQNYLSAIRLKITDEKYIQSTMEMIRKAIRSNHDIQNSTNNDFLVRSVAQALDVFNTISLAIKFFLICIAAISLIVGGIGITNIMLMTVKERTREIGLRKALGAKTFHINRQFILESIVLTSVGGTLGIIFGVSFSFLVSLAVNAIGYEWEFSVSIIAISISFFISMLVGLVFGIYPARKAASLNPIEALRYE